MNPKAILAVIAIIAVLILVIAIAFSLAPPAVTQAILIVLGAIAAAAFVVVLIGIVLRNR